MGRRRRQSADCRTVGKRPARSPDGGAPESRLVHSFMCVLSKHSSGSDGVSIDSDAIAASTLCQSPKATPASDSHVCNSLVVPGPGHGPIGPANSARAQQGSIAGATAASPSPPASPAWSQLRRFYFPPCCLFSNTAPVPHHKATFTLGPQSLAGVALVFLFVPCPCPRTVTPIPHSLCLQLWFSLRLDLTWPSRPACYSILVDSQVPAASAKHLHGEESARTRMETLVAHQLRVCPPWHIRPAA